MFYYIGRARFYRAGPVALWQEKERLRKKLTSESEDYRLETVVLRTLGLYWIATLAILVPVAYFAGKVL